MLHNIFWTTNLANIIKLTILINVTHERNPRMHGIEIRTQTKHGSWQLEALIRINMLTFGSCWVMDQSHWAHQTSKPGPKHKLIMDQAQI